MPDMPSLITEISGKAVDAYLAHKKDPNETIVSEIRAAGPDEFTLEMVKRIIEKTNVQLVQRVVLPSEDKSAVFPVANEDAIVPQVFRKPEEKTASLECMFIPEEARTGNYQKLTTMFKLGSVERRPVTDVIRDIRGVAHKLERYEEEFRVKLSQLAGVYTEIERFVDSATPEAIVHTARRAGATLGPYAESLIRKVANLEVTDYKRELYNVKGDEKLMQKIARWKQLLDHTKEIKHNMDSLITNKDALIGELKQYKDVLNQAV